MDISHKTSAQSPAQSGEDNEGGVPEQTQQGPRIPVYRTSDIAERQQAEEQLEFQAAILRYVTDSVIVTDLQGTITYWNEGSCAVFGYTAEEMIGKTPQLLYPDQDPTQSLQDYERLLAGFDYLGEWQGRRKDGTTVWVDARTTILRDTQGTAIGLIGICKDITARKELMEEVARSKEQLEIILRNVADGIIVVDANDRLIYVNDVVARQEGFPSATAMLAELPESLGHRHDQFTTWDEWGRPLAPNERPTVQALSGKPAQGLVQYQDKDTGQVFWSLVRAHPIFDAKGQVQFVVSVYTDLTEQKELEQRKDHFISMASHELKTPLTVLSAYTQLLREWYVAEGRQDAMLYLSKMNDQITNLTRLVVDLLDISKMQAGQIEMAQEAVDMDLLVHEVVESLQPTTSHHLLIEGETRGTIAGDRERLGQVMIILLNNAIKYSPHADTVKVRIARTGEGDKLTVAVQDFGIGIGKEHQSRLFERFYRVLSKKDKTYPGLGIGLYIAHEIIQRHGGKLWVESVEGSGSTFFFSLPT
jgi:PAS domain S-box-containing protein